MVAYFTTALLMTRKEKMKLAWATDLHLEWLNDTLNRFLRNLAESETEGVVISGDISYSKQIKYHLKRLSQLPMPVYFVLGNHDIYESSFDYVHQMVRASVKKQKNLVWLTEARAVQLTDETYLIGHDGWADGRAGLGPASGFLLNDYKMISDFNGMPVTPVFELMRDRADAASRRLTRQIKNIGAKHIIVVTHAPPYVQACLYNGKVSDENYLPHFSNIGLGEALTKVVEKTGARLTILCGHTHGKADVTINENIRVRVGWAQYGNPTFTTIDVDT